MQKKHLNTLEFPQILSRLAQHTTFSAGKELALALEPSPVFVEVEQRLQETREARHLIDTHGGLSLGGVHDIRPLAQSARRGAILQTGELLNIHSTLRVGRRVHRSVSRLQGRVPLLADIAARIEPCDALVEEIGRCIDAQGEVVDQASVKLAHIRRELHTVLDRLLSKLNHIVANPRNVIYLQEALITQREGRYVIPIKADFKGRIRGIVHDTSASGATLFIEPLATVDLGNQWRELQIDEQKEIERILAELSARVGDLADEVTWTVEALAQLDLALAKAHYANALNATEPKLVPWAEQPKDISKAAKPEASSRTDHIRHPGSTLDLRQARHPLLDPDKVVPIDVCFDQDYFVLVLTGPNTGGKTVSLKTVGLMAAMTQSGLHPPVADGSVLTVFDGIYADIGDEQSIEQSLSTFSSHMVNIVHILEHADRRSLLLFDELGAGTDPVEGSALARAILGHLLERRITTMVATHYSELKAYAHTTPGVENASLKFDLETLSPTYQFQIGLPGRSNAFAIAQRLGMSTEIVREARALVSPEELQTESLLSEIQEAHREAVTARDDAQVMQRRMVEQERKLAARLAGIEGERSAILGEARAEIRRQVDAFLQELGLLRSEAQDLQRQSSITEEWLAQARARLEEMEKELAPPKPPSPPEVQRLPGSIVVGDTVWVAGLNATGELTALDGDSAEVQVGSFGVRVNRGELERRARAKPPESDGPAMPMSSTSMPGVELDVRGRRVEEVLPQLDKYLDDAFLAGMPFVCIIHGKGTGALRHAVRQQLRGHPLVKSYRSGEEGEGGTGVTVAYLAGD